ncbi:MAG TPA: AAA family ATPase [Bryobacteraceae bacterium]|jgi:SpoVK/Ycf46/Vps4 family AAA+-type ATPase
MPITLAPTIECTPDQHFRSCFLSAVDKLLSAAAEMLGSRQDLLRQFPFLEDYAEILDNDESDWSTAPAHLPLKRLQEAAALSDDAILLLMVVGLNEEDARFGPFFEALQDSPGRHPTLGLLIALWRSHDDCKAVREDLRQLRELGLIHVINPEAPRLEWALEPATLLWDFLRGERPETIARWARLTSPGDLPDLGELILPLELRNRLRSIPALLTSRDLRAVIVRGPQNNGRRSVLGAIARQVGRALLEIAGPYNPTDERLRLVGPLATVLHAMPVFEASLAPGETADLPQLSAFDGPLGIILERHGGLVGAGAEGAITLTLELPGPVQRREHWDRATLGPADSVVFGNRFRLSSGNIRRAAALARSYAMIEGRHSVDVADVRDATRSLNRQALETIAVHIPCSGDWDQMAAPPDTLSELRNLEQRCRHREHLRDHAGTALGGSLNCGVRALFSGPSGTGKTMAARLLASTLEMDLYRVDLSSVVNKFLGETEKSLNQVFSRAEEHDVVLLLDEGDALLTNRTSVQTSNDRWANLETNFLLQRIESFEGILVVTTNAGARIDSAFQRRMDVVVDFRPPEPRERCAIWQIHLPPEHQVDAQWLQEVAYRCVMNGGQIRNAVLHASLLALSSGEPIRTAHVEDGVQREYRKCGAVCPLRRSPALR